MKNGLKIKIEAGFKALEEFLQKSDWRGRENEIVNLFAHRFLASQIAEGSSLFSIEQIGIEVAVPQVTGSVKEYVRKDLVIWPVANSTPWTTDKPPCAIIEWKVNDLKKCNQDVEWLKLFSKRYPDCLLYSACAFVEGKRGCSFQLITDTHDDQNEL